MSPLFFWFFLQRHSPGLSGGVAQELRGHAGADAGREGLFGDRLSAREGMRELQSHCVSYFSATFITVLLSYLSVFILTESKNRDLKMPRSLAFHIIPIFRTLFLIPASSGAASCD